MRVLVAPGLDLSPGSRAAAVAAALAGSEGRIVSLAALGVPALTGRPLSQAEVALVREALAGDPQARSAAGAEAAPAGSPPVVGYVCEGRPLAATVRGTVIAVCDHAGLTWRSPLNGPNDDSVGPRFPRVDEVYVPHAVIERVTGLPGVTINSATVAGVRDQEHPSDWERQMAGAVAIPAVSTALVSVAIIAAHMGARLAAAVLV